MSNDAIFQMGHLQDLKIHYNEKLTQKHNSEQEYKLFRKDNTIQSLFLGNVCLNSYEMLWRLENEMNVSQNQKNERRFDNLLNSYDSYNSNNELCIEEGERITEHEIVSDGD